MREKKVNKEEFMEKLHQYQATKKIYSDVSVFGWPPLEIWYEDTGKRLASDERMLLKRVFEDGEGSEEEYFIL